MITIVITYFFFKTLLIFGFVYDLGNCLYPTWQLNKNELLSPFNIFLGNAILLFGWLLFQIKRSLKNSVTSILPLIVVGFIFFYFWFRAFYGLWWFFELERNAITKQQYMELTGGYSVNYHSLDYEEKISEMFVCKVQYNKPFKQDK